MADENRQPEIENYDNSVPDVDIFADPEAGEEQAASEAKEEPTEQDEKVEAQPAEEIEENKEPASLPDNVQRAMEDITRRDSDLRQRELAIKQQLSSLQDYEELKRQIKEDPLKAIENSGGDLTAAMDAMLPDPEAAQMANNPVVKKLMAEIDGLKSSQNKQQEILQKEKHEQAQLQVYREYEKYSKGVDAKAHPVLATFADELAPQTMFNMASRYAQQHGTLPTTEELAKQTEQLLKQQASDILDRLAKVPEFAGRFKEQGDNGASQKDQAPTRTTPKETTLRNRDTSEPPGRAKELDWSTATNEEIIQRALASGDIFDRNTDNA